MTACRRGTPGKRGVPLRAILYARYSTELQSDKSVPDQLAEGRRVVSRLEGAVVGEPEWDEARRGTATRAGWERVKARLRHGEANAVWVESVSRFSRQFLRGWQEIAGSMAPARTSWTATASPIRIPPRAKRACSWA